jgi:hypothetical protein
MESVAVKRAWLWPNLLSLDAPIVAVLWQVLFARCFHADIYVLPAALLMLAVWLIYAADRVFDGLKKTASQPRHEFYRRNWRVVLPVWSGALAIASWLACTRLPSTLLVQGAVLLAGVATYFAAVHFAHGLGRWKEAAVAVLFALGTSLAAWPKIHSVSDAAPVVLFSCLCWINCVAIERWERRESAPWLAAAMVAVVGVLVLPWLHRPVLGGAETASALGFVLLNRRRDRLSADAMRVLADVALLSPIVFLPIAGLRA